ncbi:stress-induced protein [Pseudomonas entomophila]|uniref:KGG domain-containing protein n=1 Tax=Pseudomonas entomophila TaxID=312306 RepID=UPI0015E29B1F|nr:KGG domain-containing protein [Pseudomonas entomophila]MBA1189608.1 stress-induced protein [Pseudomonas entomophila]
MASNKQGGSQSSSGQKGSGNFADDRQKASEAGKKGGKASGTSHDKSSESGHKGGRS